MSVAKFMTDGVTPANWGLFSKMTDVVVRGNAYLSKKDPFSYSADVLTFDDDVIVYINNGGTRKTFFIDEGTELSDADLDTGSFAVGTDYYVYLVDDGAAGTLMISANATYPYAQTADNSRKIGGFHYGHIRKVSSDGLWVPIDSESTKFGTGSVNWKNNIVVGIVPNSVWDLLNRPSCSPEGMVKVGKLWVDMYIASASSSITFEASTNGLHIMTGGLQSKYGQDPVTGTEGMNWYTFSELAERAGKRLLSYSEWVKGAYGNPQGEDAADNYGWTKTTNAARARTGASVNNSTGAYDAASGIKKYAVSAYNLIDCVGNVWEWLDELSNDHTTTSYAYQNVLGAGKGQAYLPNATGLRAYLAGGYWNSGVIDGCRAVYAHYHPWSVATGIGCRLSCDAL